MTHQYEATVSLVDHMNPSIGYEVKITQGRFVILHTANDPVDGSLLLDFGDALRVLDYYRNPPID